MTETVPWKTYKKTIKFSWSSYILVNRMTNILKF